MALTQADQDEFWQVLKDTPLVQKWAEFRSVLLPRLTLKAYNPGDTVFRPGDPPLHLFIVARGRVVMTLQEGGETWYEQELGPGQTFGQHALFDEAYRAVARVPAQVGPAQLLLMDAADLRVALERVPTLREDLLHEGRAARLRRIPLFRRLTDDHVRWLAQLVEEHVVAQPQSVHVAEMPGIWIVDQGQIAVKGAIHPYPAEWESWSITAGNFFVAVGGPAHRGMRFGLNCAADSAVARVDSHLFYLPADHADRLITIFPDIRNLVQRPIDIVALLDAAPLFKDLIPRHKQHLAQFCGWEFVPERQNITTQGNPGHSYVIIREGGAIITAFDNYGRERPRSRVEPIHAYGQTSLLEGKPRDATVRAVRGEAIRGWPGLPGADIVTLDARDFRHAIAEKPELWKGVTIAHEVAIEREKKQEFSWMREGEVVMWSGRPHMFWLIWPLVLVGAVILALGLLVIVLPGDFGGIGGTALLIVTSFILIPLALGIVINYYDDYYVVTNRRVTRRDRQLLLFESRAEAPVEMIQDVTIDTNFWGRIFDYGDVTVRTASRSGPIRLDNTPEPYRLKDVLELARSEAQAEERGRQKEELRRGLIHGLRLALPVPQRQRALGDVPSPDNSVIPWFRRIFSRRSSRQDRVPTPPSTKAWLAKRSTRLPDSLRTTLFGRNPPARPAQELPGMIIWRKHWLSALARIGPPFLGMLIAVILAVLLLADMIKVPFLNAVALMLGWLVLMVVLAGWFWWEYVDYRNDIYVVTDDRVIDIEMKPLGLNAKRREGGLEKVQNVVFQQNGLWAKLFNYGNVVISTAASDEGFTFNMVPNPEMVQATVFQKLNQFRSRDERQRTAARQRELIEALSVYHQLRGSGGQADGFGR